MSARKKIKSLVNRRFGYLTVIAIIPNSSDCRTHCNACGKNEIRTKKSLYRLKSCGCERGRLISIGKIRHGAGRANLNTPEYVCWKNIKARCSNPRREDYPLYGGRQIRVSLRWQRSFEAFLRDMGPKPTPRHSIDRKNNDKGYCKSNCRWATNHQQRMNQRRMLKAA